MPLDPNQTSAGEDRRSSESSTDRNSAGWYAIAGILALSGVELLIPRLGESQGQKHPTHPFDWIFFLGVGLACGSIVLILAVMYQWPPFGEKIGGRIQRGITHSRTSVLDPQRWRLRRISRYLPILILLSVAIVIGLLNVNWWIALPATLVVAIADTLLSDRTLPSGFQSSKINSLVSVVMIFVIGALAFNLGLTLRTPIIRQNTNALPNFSIGQCTASGAPSLPPKSSLKEVTASASPTWADYCNAGGRAGRTIGAGQEVAVACKVEGFAAQDANTWWYLISSKPWANKYFASADSFYNDGDSSGPLNGTPLADHAVPQCAMSKQGGNQTVSFAKVTLMAGKGNPNGGYWYGISGTGFAPNSSVTITCFDSDDPDGFFPFKLTADGAGAFSTDGPPSGDCSSASGPEHWVTANGVESNHVRWVSPGPGEVTLTEGATEVGSNPDGGYWYDIAGAGFAPNSSVALTCSDSGSPDGFFTFKLTADGSGSFSTDVPKGSVPTEPDCWSASGPEHRVTANGIESNPVRWSTSGIGTHGGVYPGP
jgi:uncharacterized membrane protein SpoIIM required for sporulation